MPALYAVQFPIDKWVEDPNALRHKTLQHCSIGLHGGSDICMSGGCVNTTVTLGDVRFGRIRVGNNFSIYTSYDNAARASIAYEIYADEQPEECRKDGEDVLATIKLRPDRGCTDIAAFVSDVTIPDNTVMTPETRFTKTWRLRNAGTCTWTPQYTLLILGKSEGTQADWAYLQEEVRPGQTTDISMELAAPSVKGVARWEGVLQNELRDRFGLGTEPNSEMSGKPFWVQIIVRPASTP